MSESLTQKVLRFFRENPEEELTYNTFCMKFGCEMHTAREIIRRQTYARIVRGRRIIPELESVHVIRANPAFTESKKIERYSQEETSKI